MAFPTSLAVLLALSPAVQAGGFRCGTRLVLPGDSVARLSSACGAPDRTFKAKITVTDRGRTSTARVTQWVYERRGRRPMIVSVEGGTVVHIQRG